MIIWRNPTSYHYSIFRELSEELAEPLPGLKNTVLI